MIPSGSDRRIAGFAALTEGATNSGSMSFATMNAGTFALRGTFDHLGNFKVFGPLVETEGAVLKVS